MSEQRQTTKRTFELPGIGNKTYEFPTVFRGVELLSVQLLLPALDAARWLPAGYALHTLLGRAFVMATAQHFASPVGMAPYTEASLALRVIAPGGGRGWHTLTMPVDSAENMQRGLVIFGYPKEMARLALSGPEGRRAGEVIGADGRALFSVEVAHTVIPGPGSRGNTSYQQLAGRTVCVKSRIDGRLRAGTGHVRFGEALRERLPGLPAEKSGIVGARFTDAQLTLELPTEA